MSFVSISLLYRKYMFAKYDEATKENRTCYKQNVWIIMLISSSKICEDGIITEKANNRKIPNGEIIFNEHEFCDGRENPFMRNVYLFFLENKGDYRFCVNLDEQMCPTYPIHGHNLHNLHKQLVQLVAIRLCYILKCEKSRLIR